jgi:biotin transporter BioY
MLLAPWIIGKPAGEAFELLFVFATVVIGLVLMYLFGRFWQN